jgi:integrase
MTEPKSQLANICKATGITFMLHDLRRTFATHATNSGVSYELIQKALNHKSGSVTSGYIIKNVEMMRPVFNTVFEAYTKMWDEDTFNEYFDPEGYQEIVDDPDDS